MSAKTTQSTRPTVASLAADVARLTDLVGKLVADKQTAPEVTQEPAVTPAPRRRGEATKVPTLTPRTSGDTVAEDSPRLRAFTRNARRDFVKAALKEGKDFRHEVKDGDKVRLVGWTSVEIVTWCLANDYCPAGWRIADGWRDRINAK